MIEVLEKTCLKLDKTPNLDANASQILDVLGAPLECYTIELHLYVD